MANLETIRHSLAHILAYAVQELYPETKFGIGPAIENGFYYDFELPQKISPQDLLKIEQKMRELISQDLKFKKKEVSTKEAKNIFKNQPYKLELIQEAKKSVSIYQSGNFTDLCKGPHIKSTAELNPEAFKLTKIAGAYWKGNEENPMLTRIYGVAFKTESELKKFLEKEEEAKRRDHRRLGKKLDLFLFDQQVGAGLPLWQPKGALLWKTIEDFLVNRLLEEDYKLVRSPHIAREKLFEKSGHLDFYKQNMYSPIEIEEQKYYLKPMNCPFHMKIYNSEIRSYKDLPLKLAELGTVYRYEKSGVLHGLTRVRGFTQDDAHIFCTKSQLGEELLKLLKFSLEILKTFGFEEFEIYLSTRPKQYVGTKKIWKKATNALKYALAELDVDYEIDKGEGVFYGPKIDIKIKDSLGRAWQCTTIQVDFNLPQKFDSTFVNQTGKPEPVIMIHRAILGSMERFIGVLLEHHAGLPLWLAPEQVWIIPVGNRHQQYANQVAQEFKQQQIRVRVRNENLTVSKKVRQGEVQRIPYLLVVGDDEQDKNAVRVRYESEDLGLMKIDEFIKRIKTEKRVNR